MLYCAHDPGLALLMAGEDGPYDQAAPPVLVRIIMIGILAMNLAALTIIALG